MVYEDSTFNSSFVCFWNMIEERKESHDVVSQVLVTGIYRNVFVCICIWASFIFICLCPQCHRASPLAAYLLQMRSAEN
jgi:formate/nitrite transporter FocA (FNT family)